MQRPLAQYSPHNAAVLTKAFLRAGQYLDLSHAALARIIRTSEASMSRIAGGKHINREQSECALMLLRIFRSLDSLFGGNTQQCRLWLASHNYHLSGKPVELIQSIRGLVNVSDYLDAMRGHG